VAAGAGEDGANPTAEEAAPGALTRLLEKLAEVPAGDMRGAWAQGLRPGDVLDRFEILVELGRGGFGAVYEALDRELGRRVALKTLRPGRVRDEWADEQLRKEAQAAARLSHPGIVTLHEACTCDRGPYLVMELLRGETLEGRLARGPLPVREAVEIALQAARALANVHAHGLVHRDLKPGNLHLGEDGRVKLLDLGLAHLLGREAATGGTPAYVAPEQWRGEAVDGRADVFALGAVTFEMVSGRRAFEVKEDRSSALDPGPAPAVGAPAPRGLARLVARCLAKDPRARPTAAQAAEELLLVQRRLERPRAARRLALLLGAGAALGVAAALVVSGWRTPAAAEAGLDGRIVVAVADFANETRDPDLDGLAGLLVTSLEQSRRLRVLTRSRMVDVLRQMGRPEAARIDETLAREVGRREGVRALMHASVRKLGETYAVDLRALDPAKDEYLFALREQAKGKDAIFGLVDRLSERARRALQEPGADVKAAEIRIAEAATSSIEAWRHYAEGRAQEDAGRFDLAVGSYRRAVGIDPRFALAWFRIAYRGALAAVRGDERRAAIDAALREIDRVPEGERALILGWKARMDGRGEEAIEALSRAAEAHPGDKEIALTVGAMLLAKGDPGGAVPWLERALALDPTWGQALEQLAGALAASGRPDEAVRRARAWAERAPGLVTARVLASALALDGRPDEAVEVARRVHGKDGGAEAKRLLAEALTLDDRAAEAEALLRPLLASPGFEIRALLADALSEQGRRREALALVDGVGEPGARTLYRYLLLMGDRDPRPALREARTLYRSERLVGGGGGLVTGAFHLGDAGLAAESAAALPPGHGPLRAEYEAVLLWSRGEKRRALEGLRALERAVALNPRRHWWRARVAFELGEVEEGDRALLAFEREPAGFWRGWGRAQLLVWSAEAHARQGDRARALAALDRLDRIWARADHDLPQLADARALRRKLERGPAGDPATSGAPRAPSVAVLPFADLSPGKDQEYLSEGIAEEILNALARVDGLRVVGRTSSWFFKGKGARLADIGRELRVGTVLEGSVRREGSRLRISAQLLAVPDGRTLWSERFDRELGDVFALQEELAQAVVAALAPRLVAAAGKAPGLPRTTPEAYLQYLLGYQLWARGGEGDVRRSVEAFERALALDPGYAPAWAGLAWSLEIHARAAATLPDLLAMKRRALAAAERSVELGPGEARSYYARGGLRAYHRHEWREAMADLERAIALRPSDAAVRRVHGWILGALGRLPEGVAALGRAVDLEPLSVRGWAILAGLEMASGRLDRSREACGQIQKIAPGHRAATVNLAQMLLLEGRPAEALAAIRAGASEESERLFVEAAAEHALGRDAESRSTLARLAGSHGYSDAYDVALAHAWRGERDEAFAWLERSDAQLDGGIMWIKTDPFLASLRADPRWPALLRKLRLPVD